MKQIINPSSFFALAIVFLFTSCKKYLEIPPPENQLVTQNAFTDDKTADATLAGVYSVMNSYNYGLGNVLTSFLPAYAADEFFYAFSNATFDEFKNNALTPDNRYINSLWETSYAVIYHANAVLEGLEKTATLTESTKLRLTGEAKFVRAFGYFYLVNSFGDVPLILNTDYKVNTSMPRTEKSKVFAAILSDLTDAQKMMPDNYTSAEKIRPNKAAATTLLARTHLYMGNWDLAAAEATKVLDETKYKLLPDLNQVFLKNSEEAIWQLQSVNKSTPGVNTWEGFNLVPPTPTGRSLYSFYSHLEEAFEPEDARFLNWAKAYVTGGKTYYFPYKYKIRTAPTVEEYTMVLRFAELFLIRAEAFAQQGLLEEAQSDLNKIRERAQLADLPSGLNQEQMLAAVESERQRELFGEWGHRWFDLIRTGRAMAVLAPIKPDFSENDLLYPIPRPATRTNPHLIQNPGYN